MPGIKDQYKLEFIETEDHLQVRVNCDTITREIALAYLTDVAHKCASLGFRKLLIERNVPVMLPFTDLVEVTKVFLEMVRNVRVAFVNPHIKIGEDMDFAILYGRNRGGGYSLFNTVGEAELWLHGNSEIFNIDEAYLHAPTP